MATVESHIKLLQSMLSMTREELLARPYQDYAEAVEGDVRARYQQTVDGNFKKLSDERDQLIEQVMAHTRSLIAPQCEAYAQTFRAAYDVAPDTSVDPLVTQLSKEHGLVVYTWHLMTSGGIKDLTFCKWAHQRLGAVIMNIFQVPMGSAGVGVKPFGGR